MEWLWVFPILAFICSPLVVLFWPLKTKPTEDINAIILKTAAQELRKKQADNVYAHALWYQHFTEIEAAHAISAVGYPISGELVPPSVMEFLLRTDMYRWEVFMDHNHMVELEQRGRRYQ